MTDAARAPAPLPTQALPRSRKEGRIWDAGNHGQACCSGRGDTLFSSALLPQVPADGCQKAGGLFLSKPRLAGSCNHGHCDAITWCLTTSVFVPRGAPQITNFMVDFSPCPFLSVTLSRCLLLVRGCRAAGMGSTSQGLGPCDRRRVAGSVPVLVPALFPSRHAGDVPMPPARGAGVCRHGAGTRTSPTACTEAQGHQVSLTAPHPHHAASPMPSCSHFPNAPYSPSSPDLPPSHRAYRELLSTQDALNLREKDEPNKKLLTCHTVIGLTFYSLDLISMGLRGILHPCTKGLMHLHGYFSTHKKAFPFWCLHIKCLGAHQ